MVLIKLVLAAACLVTTAVAQGVDIWAPSVGETIVAGSNITVTINKPVRFHAGN